MVPTTWRGFSSFRAWRKREPGVMSRFSQGRKRGPSLIFGSFAEQVLHAVALFVELLQGGVHALSAEVADLDSLDELVFAALDRDGVAVDHAFGDVVAAVGGHAHGDPVAFLG